MGKEEKEEILAVLKKRVYENVSEDSLFSKTGKKRGRLIIEELISEGWDIGEQQKIKKGYTLNSLSKS
jgi:hypothetical protein